MSKAKRTLLLLCVAAWSPAGIGACSSDNAPTSATSSGQGGASVSGTSGVAVAGSGPGGSGGDGGGFAPCANTSAEAKVVPINMYIAVDKSASMDTDNKWSDVKSAFTSFFQDPEADGLSAALRFWPDSGCGEGNCDPYGCAEPLVSLGPLADPGHEEQLIAAFNATFPDGGTPMSAALGGAAMWAVNNQLSNMGMEFTVVVLLSDGTPNQCDESTSGLALLAADAYKQAKVLTFAVGLQGSNEGLMNAIAQAGKTQQAYFIGNGNAEGELLGTLKNIQKNVSACAYAMPESTSGNKEVDPSKVSVNYTPTGATESQTVPKVVDEEDCTPQAGGWYYDSPTDPHMIKLCPSSCATIKGDEGAKLEIVAGCV